LTLLTPRATIVWMIGSFRDKETERVFRREGRTTFSKPLRRAALRKLLILDAAESINDLSAVQGNRLEKLKGDRAGQYSIRINDQWRICFRWEDGNAEGVEIADYH
jgi:toxin HigB-1